MSPGLPYSTLSLTYLAIFPFKMFLLNPWVFHWHHCRIDQVLSVEYRQHLSKLCIIDSTCLNWLLFHITLLHSSLLLRRGPWSTKHVTIIIKRISSHFVATFRGGEELVVSGPVSLPIGNLTEWVHFQDEHLMMQLMNIWRMVMMMMMMMNL